MALASRTPTPGSVYLPQAVDIEMTSRVAGRSIACRLLYPSSRSTPEEQRGARERSSTSMEVGG
jgi:hypothetical protein